MQLEKHNNWVRHEKLTWFVFKFDIIHLWFTHVASHGIKDGFVLTVRNLGCFTDLTVFRKKKYGFANGKSMKQKLLLTSRTGPNLITTMMCKVHRSNG